MNQKLRNVLAVLVAVAAGNIVITLFEGIVTMQYPYPEGMNKEDMYQMKTFVASLPASAFLLVMLGHITGSFVAGLLAWVVSKQSYVPSLIAGGLFTVFGLMVLLMLDHPWWMWIELLLYMPAAYLGARLLRK